MHSVWFRNEEACQCRDQAFHQISPQRVLRHLLIAFKYQVLGYYAHLQHHLYYVAYNYFSLLHHEEIVSLQIETLDSKRNLSTINLYLRPIVQYIHSEKGI